MVSPMKVIKIPGNLKNNFREILNLYYWTWEISWNVDFLSFHSYFFIIIIASGLTGTGMSGVQFGDSSGMPPGVKVVKLSATTSGIANARTVYSPQVSDF